MKKRALCLFVALFLSACLSPKQAADTGFGQGARGEAYGRILGDNAGLHREGWIAGNAQYCRTLNYTTLARSNGALPQGICAYSQGQLRAYCGAVSYANLGRTGADLPLACSPSSGQQQAYDQAREAAFCTFANGRDDMERPAARSLRYGSCSPSSSRSACEREDFGREVKPFCQANAAYLDGAASGFARALNVSFRDHSNQLASLSALSAPTAEETEARLSLVTYLSWVGECELDGLEVDC